MLETFFRGKKKKNKRKVLKIYIKKDKFMMIPNKWEISPCMILQLAENWHKTIFNLGLKARITSLVQICN